jgi:hypothetical protein
MQKAPREANDSTLCCKPTPNLDLPQTLWEHLDGSRCGNVPLCDGVISETRIQQGLHVYTPTRRYQLARCLDQIVMHFLCMIAYFTKLVV